jgi:hypothetical protein
MSGRIAGSCEECLKKKTLGNSGETFNASQKRCGEVVTMPGMVSRLRTSREPHQRRCASRGKVFARPTAMLT